MTSPSRRSAAADQAGKPARVADLGPDDDHASPAVRSRRACSAWTAQPCWSGAKFSGLRGERNLGIKLIKYAAAPGPRPRVPPPTTSAPADASPRPATDSDAIRDRRAALVEDNWASMRCCRARRAPWARRCNRPKVRTSTTCTGGIHDSGNSPETAGCHGGRRRRGRSWRASLRHAKPRVVSRISPDAPPPPQQRGSSVTYRHPVQPSRREAPASPLAQCLPAQPRLVSRLAGRSRRNAQESRRRAPSSSNVICFPVHVKPAYHRHQWDLLKLPKNFSDAHIEPSVLSSVLRRVLLIFQIARTAALSHPRSARRWRP